MIIRITKVKEEYGWLHCMSPHPLTYEGIDFRTSESLFQYLRFEGYPKIQEEIRNQKSPMAVKMKARKYREKLNRGSNWDQSLDDIPLMRKCLLLKLNQHPDLEKKLLKTEQAIIIEDCTTHDRESARFWGAVFKNNKWIGENILGKLWMEIRDELSIKKQTAYAEM